MNESEHVVHRFKTVAAVVISTMLAALSVTTADASTEPPAGTEAPPTEDPTTETVVVTTESPPDTGEPRPRIHDHRSADVRDHDDLGGQRFVGERHRGRVAADFDLEPQPDRPGPDGRDHGHRGRLMGTPAATRSSMTRARAHSSPPRSAPATPRRSAPRTPTSSPRAQTSPWRIRRRPTSSRWR